MIAIVKYNAGNITSVKNALDRLGYEACITDDPQLLKEADKVIFPGVGAAGSAMQYLCNRGLDKLICELTQPFLGICLGMQLMCAYSEEDDTTGLGIFPNRVERIKGEVKVPHMGWNELRHMQTDLFMGLPERPDVYFVHSYAVSINEYTVARTVYGNPFSAALQKDNFYGVQFHPEKSGKVGERILDNFLKKK